MNRIARTVSYLCVCWTVLYFLWGGTSSGKAWFAGVSHIFFEDTKGGSPIVAFAFPILFAATVSAILWRRTRPGEEGRLAMLVWSVVPLWMIRFSQEFRIRALAGDALAPQAVSWSFMLLLAFYLAGTIQRKVQSAADEEYDYVVMEISNAFGIAALMAMCILLLPVTKFSPLVKVFGLSAPTALCLHQYTGRFVVIASLVHGVMHIYRWTGIEGEGFFTMIIPPTQCWQGDIDFEPTCHSKDTDCSCYDFFKNLAGLVAGTGLLVIGVSSLAPVRRHFYSVFYRIHMLAGPLVFVAVVVHWNRSILYLAGGMLYYLATLAPTAFEKLAISRKSAEGVTLVSAERITAQGRETASASFVSLTFHAEAHAVARYQPTQYIKMTVPELSSIGHPFSINRVPNEQEKLRVIIREGGAFTRQLAQRSVDGTRPPAIFIDGFHGTETRSSDILLHDVVVIIAGGIGITTYLTLIKDTVLLAKSQPLAQRRIQKVFLHWICREDHLIDYVRREYFDDISSLMASVHGLHLGIIVHRTGGTLEPSHDRAFPDVESQEIKPGLDEETSEVLTVGQPFRSSRYIVGSGASGLENLPAFLAFLSTSVAGLCGIWYLYSHVQSSEEVFSRIWALVFLVLLGSAVGVFLNLALSMFCQQQGADVEFLPIHSDEGVEMETISSIQHRSVSAGGIERAEVRSFSFEEKQGRPSIHSLLNPLEESKYPAVFCCGPGKMMNDVKTKTIGRCHMRLQRCLCGEPRIALYEEAFEM